MAALRGLIKLRGCMAMGRGVRRGEYRVFAGTYMNQESEIMMRMIPETVEAQIMVNEELFPHDSLCHGA